MIVWTCAESLYLKGIKAVYAFNAFFTDLIVTERNKACVYICKTCYFFLI